MFVNDYCYVVGKDWCCVVRNGGVDCLIVGWELSDYVVMCSGLAVLFRCKCCLWCDL